MRLAARIEKAGAIEAILRSLLAQTEQRMEAMKSAEERFADGTTRDFRRFYKWVAKCGDFTPQALSITARFRTTRVVTEFEKVFWRDAPTTVVVNENCPPLTAQVESFLSGAWRRNDVSGSSWTITFDGYAAWGVVNFLREKGVVVDVAFMRPPRRSGCTLGVPRYDSPLKSEEWTDYAGQYRSSLSYRGYEFEYGGYRSRGGRSRRRTGRVTAFTNEAWRKSCIERALWRVGGKKAKLEVARYRAKKRRERRNRALYEATRSAHADRMSRKERNLFQTAAAGGRIACLIK